MSGAQGSGDYIFLPGPLPFGPPSHRCVGAVHSKRELLRSRDAAWANANIQYCTIEVNEIPYNHLEDLVGESSS